MPLPVTVNVAPESFHYKSFKESISFIFIPLGSTADRTPTISAAHATLTTNTGSFGLFYPDMGVILLNAKRLDAGGGAADITTARSADAFDDNPKKLFNTKK